MTQTRKKLVFSWVLILAMVISVISPGSVTFVNAEETTDISSLSDSYAAKLKGVTDYMKKNLEVSADSYSYGFEWRIMQQARNGQDEKKLYHAYYDSVKKMLEEGSTELKTSSYATIIIALTSIGADPTNIGGTNLLKGLSDYSVMEYDYASNIAYALIALDSKKYEAPSESQENPATRDKIVNLLINNLNSETGLSGYEWDGVFYDDMDTTMMIIQALAPYYSDNTKVKTIVDKALDTLSKKQNNDGSFGDYDCVSTTSQMICALTALGIDPENDARFIKDKVSTVDYILSQYNNDTGEISIKSDSEFYNPLLSAEQAAYALTAYDRLVKNNNSLYDMTDSKSHIYNKVSTKNAKEATCTAAGYTGDKVCDDCGEVLEKGKEIAKKAHTPVEIPAVAATETTPGKTAGKKCSVCGEILEQPKEVPATGKTGNTEEKKEDKVEEKTEEKTVFETEYKVTGKKNTNVEYTGTSNASAKSIVIPATVTDTKTNKKYKVTKVAAGALKNNKTVTSVTVGKNVTEIGKNAFNGCKKAKTFKIYGNKLTKVGKNAFKNIKKNAKIIIYAKNKKTYNKVKNLIKKSGAKNVKYQYKNKK